MDATDVKTIIYLITCLNSGKQYIGQTRTHKLTRGKWYNYGIKTRFAEHIRSSKTKTTPIAKEIAKYGSELFSIEEVDICEISEADSYEAYYIAEYETLVPYGYNVQKSSRSKKGSYYTDSNILSAELRGIKCNGNLSKIRLLLLLENGEKRRVMFGTDPGNFKESLREAKDFCANLGIDPVEHNSLIQSPELWWPYKEKMIQFEGKSIVKIRIVPFSSNMISVYVRTTDMKSYKDEIRICFGSSKISKQKSLQVALSVADKLCNNYGGNYHLDDKLY